MAAHRFLFCLVLLIATGAVLAHDREPAYDRIAFGESARTDVDNDIMVATLFVQREGQRSAELARAVNSVVDRAVNRANSIPGIKVQTLSYRTNAIYNKSSISGWRVSQSIRLESRDSRLIGDLIGKLQDEMQVQSLGYQVSDESRREQLDGLVEEALARFQARAERIRRAMGRDSYRVVRLNIDTGDGTATPRPQPMFRAEMAMNVAAAPRIEAGTQSVEVRVSGEIELSLD